VGITVSVGTYWYDTEGREVLIYEGYMLSNGVLFLYRRLLDPDARTAFREAQLRRLRQITEVEALALVSK
jgi:hypothetical protein